MDERTTELVAIGAAAAVNCHPCLRFHVDVATKSGLTPEEIEAAVEIGLLVNKGAAEATRGFSRTVLADLGQVPSAGLEAASCCGTGL